MIHSKIKTIYFDFDGTLIDHFQVIFESFAYAQKELGVPLNSFEHIKSNVGPSILISLATLLGEENVTKGLELVTHYYEEHIYRDIYMLPGVVWLLESLRKSDKKIVLFTNKPQKWSEQLIDHLNLKNYFDAIIGSHQQKMDYKKPNKIFSEHALNFVGALSESSVMIGDSPFDIDAAAVVDMHSLIVTTGTHSIEEINSHENQPYGVYENLYSIGESVFELSLPKDKETEPILYKK